MTILWVLIVGAALCVVLVFTARALLRSRMPSGDGSANLRRQADKLVRRGLKHLRQGNLESARQELEVALPLYEKIGDLRQENECLVTLGRILSELGDTVGALAHMRRAVGQGDSRDGELRFHATLAMGELLLELGRPSVALACFREALIQPCCPENPLELPEAARLRQALTQVMQDKLCAGRSRVEAGDYAEARRQYQDGLNLARDPLFAPLSDHETRGAYKHYENLLKVEMAHLFLRLNHARSQKDKPEIQVLAV